MANELYGVLGVTPDADPATLRKSYFRLLRVHTAEKDPARHQELRGAYEVLGDEHRRKDYDGRQVGAGEVGRLLEEGSACLAAEEYDDAERLFKRAVALAPDHLPARLQLARAVSSGGDRRRAVQLLQAVVRLGENDLEFWSQLGWTALAEVVIATENEPKNMDAAQRRLLKVATDAFDRCIVLAPRGRTGYFGRARVAFYAEDWEATRTWARKSATCDGVTDFEDLDALSLVVETHIIQAQIPAAVAAMQEIRRVAPDQAEVRAFVAEKFAKFGLMLMKLNAYGPAAEIFTACLTFAPEDEQLQRLAKDNLCVVRAHEELERTKEDRQLDPVFRLLAAWGVGRFTGEIEDEDSDSYFDKAIDALDETPPWQVVSGLKRLRDRYPNIWRCQDTMFQRLLDTAQKVQQGAGSSAPPPRPTPPSTSTELASRPSSTPAPDAGGCGCLVLFALLVPAFAVVDWLTTIA